MKPANRALAGYDSIRAHIVALLESARRASARTVNALMTATYWEIGRRIVEVEQGGKRRADYGERLIERLAADLMKRFGRGFGARNMVQMRALYFSYPDIVRTPSARFLPGRGEILQTPSAEFADLSAIARRFPLPWFHYVLEFLGLKDQYSETVVQKEPALNGRLAIVDAFAILVTRLVELPICDSYVRPVAQFPRLANAAGRFHL